MSTHHLPYPSDFEVNHAASHHEDRRRQALQSIDVGDVLAQVDDLIASEPDPTKHPCYGLVAFLLDRQLVPRPFLGRKPTRKLMQEIKIRFMDQQRVFWRAKP
jgi:hypothetical protein